MCAHAVRVAVEKLPGVDSVQVSLNAGYADIALAPQNSITVEQVRNVIRRNGFSPRETRVRVRGVVERHDGRLILQLPAGATFQLSGAQEVMQQLMTLAESGVTVDGQIQEWNEEEVEATLQVLRVDPQEAAPR